DAHLKLPTFKLTEGDEMPSVGTDLKIKYGGFEREGPGSRTACRRLPYVHLAPILAAERHQVLAARAEFVFASNALEGEVELVTRALNLGHSNSALVCLRHVHAIRTEDNNSVVFTERQRGDFIARG